MEKTEQRSISVNRTVLAQVDKIAEHHGISYLGFSGRIRFIVKMVYDMIPRIYET